MIGIVDYIGVNERRQDNVIIIVLAKGNELVIID